MRRRLPPFAALKAFEAAGAHNNFKKAAEDINLSASAVSHQVRSLEEFLGVQLFNRESGKPQLTTAGASYLEEIQTLFNRLDVATKNICERGKRRSLVVNLYHSLASSWFLPHLPIFQKLHPDIDIKLLSSQEPMEFTSSDIDLAIRYGEGNWSGLKSDLLFHDELILACTPEMAKQLPPMDRLEELKQFTQIRCSLDLNEWKVWFDHTDAELPDFQSSMELDGRALAIEAAAEGLGIVIARMPYVLDSFRTGRLCSPYPLRIRCPQQYYLVYPEHHSSYENVACFRDWLLEECLDVEI